MKNIKSDKKIKPDMVKWSPKEGINVFANSFLIFIIIESILLFHYTAISPENFNWISVEIPINIGSLFLSKLPYIFLAVPPIFYIYRKKLNITKIGFRSKIIKEFVVYGIISGVIFWILDYLSHLFMSLFESMGWSALSQPNYIQEQNQIIQGMGGWVVLFVIIIIVKQIAEDILFRGVLQNSLDDFYSKKNENKLTLKIKIKSSFIISMIYALIFFLLTFSVYTLIINIITSLIIGFFYESSEKSMTSLITMRIVYTGIVVIFLII